MFAPAAHKINTFTFAAFCIAHTRGNISILRAASAKIFIVLRLYTRGNVLVLHAAGAKILVILEPYTREIR